jgi:hypothetical protein
MRLFRLISALIALVWATPTLADPPLTPPGWTTYMPSLPNQNIGYSADAATACRISADEHFQSAKYGTAAVDTENWWHKRCFYHNLVGGLYNDYTQLYFECPAGLPSAGELFAI